MHERRATKNTIGRYPMHRTGGRGSLHLLDVSFIYSSRVIRGHARVTVYVLII